MVSVIWAINQPLSPKMVKISISIDFFTKFYVRYRSEEISPHNKPPGELRYFWGVIVLFQVLFFFPEQKTNKSAKNCEIFSGFLALNWDLYDTMLPNKARKNTQNQHTNPLPSLFDSVWESPNWGKKWQNYFDCIILARSTWNWNISLTWSSFGSPPRRTLTV